MCYLFLLLLEVDSTAPAKFVREGALLIEDADLLLELLLPLALLQVADDCRGEGLVL